MSHANGAFYRVLPGTGMDKMTETETKHDMASNKNNTHPETIWNAKFISIFAANACMYISIQMVNSLVAKYADYMGAVSSVVGLVSSIYAVTALVLKIFSGPAIDTFNRSVILVCSMSAVAISFFGYSVSHSIQMLLFSRLLQGAGLAFTTTCCLAVAADTLPSHKIGSGIGVFSMAQAASQAIGPTVSLTLMDLFGYSITFAIGGCLMVFAAVLASRVNVPYDKSKKFKINIRNIAAKEAMLPAVIMLFLSMTNMVIHSFLIIYAGINNVSNIGLYFTVYAVTMLITRPMTGRLMDRHGLIVILVPSLFIFAGAFIMISFARSLPMFLLSAFVSAFGYGASQPAIQTLSMKSVPSEKRGIASSTNYIGIDLGSFCGPIIAGIFVDAFGYDAMWRLMIFPVATALIIAVFNRKRIARIAEEFKIRQQAVPQKTSV
jgi:MFS family permease